MANKKISELNQANALGANDQFAVVQGTETKKTSLGDIATGVSNLGNFNNVQADWDEANVNSDAFIKNKPALDFKTINGNNITGTGDVSINVFKDIINETSGYNITAQDAGMLFVNSGSPTRDLNLGAVSNPLNVFFIKGRIMLNISVGITVLLPDNTQTNAGVNFVCLADSFYIVQRTSYAQSNWQIIALNQSSNQILNLSNSNLVSTSDVRKFSLNGVASTNKFIIDNGVNSIATFLGNGNIGLNTEPSAKFHVDGSLKFEGIGEGIGKVLTSDANGNATWQTTPNVASVTKEYFHFSMTGTASSDIGKLFKTSGTGKATTDPGDPGFNSGMIDPYVVHNDCSLASIRVNLANAATSGFATNNQNNISIRLQLFKANYSTRTLIATIDVPLVQIGNVGVWTNLSNNSFQSCVKNLESDNITLSAGDMIGLQFTNVPNNNSFLDAVGKLNVSLEVIND